jgi:cytochrome P450
MTMHWPPGPKEPPLLQLIAYVRQPYEFMERMQRQHGDVFTMNLPGLGRHVLVSSPSGLRELTSGSYDEFERFAGVLHFLLGQHSVIFQEGGPHRRIRKLLTPSLHGDAMRSHGPTMLRVTDDVLDRYRDGQVVKLHADMQEITLRVILHCVFGLDEGPRFERIRVLLTEFLQAMLTPWAFGAGLMFGGRRVLNLVERLGERTRRQPPDGDLTLSRLPLLRQADRLGAIDAILFDEIERCQRAPEGRTDMLATLVSARDEHDQPMTREEMRDQLITMMVGGHETTANSLCWALFQLATRPDVCDAMRREVSEVFQHGFDPALVNKLHYVGAVIQESMRLMPIGIGVARKLKVPLTVEGHRLEPGTVVLPTSFLAQRDPRHFRDPLAFEPARFLGKKPDMHAHFPFGAGVWRCLGASFADYEMRVVLARFLARFDIELLPGQKAQPFLEGITIRPADGMPLKLHVRKDAALAPVLAAEA